ncbi:MAG: DUF3592 domain-containing protein [Anaerolineales bacterium]|nr:DUF3592 domain-containing protein [Anaerolineales bacterium]MBK9782230.1 DUF3592 domain-containing protein [Anaerolineales bacterium]
MIGKLDPETLRANETKMNKRGKLIGATMMIGSIILTLVLGTIAYFSTIQRLNWLETSGRVTNSFFTRDINRNEEKYSYDYEYSVDGITYSGSDSEIGALVSKSPAEGASITVYYDPNNPGKSLTDTNKSAPLSDFVVWTVCCGPIFFVFGAIILFVSTRKSQIVG